VKNFIELHEENERSDFAELYWEIEMSDFLGPDDDISKFQPLHPEVGNA
jgi:hypothetical protein